MKKTLDLLETRAHDLERQVPDLEIKHSQLTTKLDRLSDDVRDLSSVNRSQTQLPRMIETAVRERLEKEMSQFKATMEVSEYD
jgi:cell division protein FtsL